MNKMTKNENPMLTWLKNDIKGAMKCAIDIDDWDGVRKYLEQIEEVEENERNENLIKSLIKSQ
jgi:hypothetical protein